jgi:hypothetical protein
MAHLDRTELGYGTTIIKWCPDINTGTYAAPVWVAINGIASFTPNFFEPTLVDDSDFDGAGGTSQQKTALTWGASITVRRKVKPTDATLYDVGQEALRTCAKTLSSAGIADMRFYEVTAGGPIAEAYRGFCEVAFKHGGGEMSALDQAEITLTGRGLLADYVHPDYANVAPVLYSVTPSTGPAAGGVLVKIVGRGFFLAGVSQVVATGVKLAAHNFSPYTVDSDQFIWAVTPAEDAGTTNVTVTNAIGASNALPFVTTT